MIIMLLLNIILWVLIVALILIFLLLFLPINLELRYEDGKFDFKLKLWFLRVDTLGQWFSTKGDKNPEKESKKGKNKSTLKSIQSSAKYVKAFVTESGKIMKMIIKSIVFKRLNLKIVVGNEDASKTATTYGSVCATVYPVSAAFVSVNEPKNYDISVTPDFVSDKIRIFADIKLKTRVISLLIVAIKLLIMIKSKIK